MNTWCVRCGGGVMGGATVAAAVWGWGATVAAALAFPHWNMVAMREWWPSCMYVPARVRPGGGGACGDHITPCARPGGGGVCGDGLMII